MYGAGGYYEFTGYPDLKPHDEPNQNLPDAPAALKAPDADNGKPEAAGPPLVDVTMRLQEGQQFFVNRITFVGNTTTRDNVIRREMRLVEEGVFNTEALKYSIKRLNQLGYFKALEGRQGRQRRKIGGRDEQGRRPAEAGRAEPQPAHVRRRRVGVRRLLRSAVVPDSEFPRPRREPHAVAAGRIARAELLARLHRAVPVRPEHHRRASTCSGPTSATSASSRRNRSAPSLTFGFPLGTGVHADVHELQLPARAGHRNQRGLYGLRWFSRGIRSCAIRCSSGRTANASSARWRPASSTTPSTSRFSRRPASGTRRRSIWPGSAATRTTTGRWSKASGISNTLSRLTLGLRAQTEYIRSFSGSKDCRFSRSCSSAANTRSAASTSAPSGRRIRSPASCSAATSCCCSTSKSRSRLRDPSGRFSFSTPARFATRARPFAWQEDIVQPVLPLLVDPFATVSLTGVNALFPQNQTVVAGQRECVQDLHGR